MMAISAWSRGNEMLMWLVRNTENKQYIFPLIICVFKNISLLCFLWNKGKI